MSLYRPRVIQKPMKCNKHQRKLLLETEKRLNQETDRQVDLVYHATAIALNRIAKWKGNRITELTIFSQKVWDDCAASNDISMVQLCEHETGIDLRRNTSDTDYEDIIYLNSEKDTGKQMTIFEWIAMRQQQIKWVPTQIVACVLITLHRKEGWGITRLGRFLNVLEEVKMDYDYDEQTIKKASKEITGFELIDGMI